MRRHFVALVFGLIPLAPVAAQGGQAKTPYPFQVEPERALHRLRELGKVLRDEAGPNPDELALFAAVKHGTFTSDGFAEAVLLASGATDGAQRRLYLGQLSALETAARNDIDRLPTVEAKADRLLRILHARAMAKGYDLNQTKVSTLLDSGRFNCVSSAALYNVLGLRLGLELRAVEVPQHVFSVLRANGRTIDIETTNKNGFNPGGKRQRPDGVGYDPVKDRGKRRDIAELGLIATIYANRCADLEKGKRFFEGATLGFSALSLDRDSELAVRNTLACLTNWTPHLATEKKFEEGVRVADLACELAPKVSQITGNRRYVWQTYLENSLDQAPDVRKALALRAGRILGVREVRSLLIGLADKRIEPLVRAARYEDALLQARKLSQAWDEASDRAQLAAMVYDRWSEALRKKKDLQGAAEVYHQALKDLPSNDHVRNNLLAAYDAWAAPLKKDNEWSKAIEVYERALQILPQDRHLLQQVKYCQQQAKKN